MLFSIIILGALVLALAGTLIVIDQRTNRTEAIQAELVADLENDIRDLENTRRTLEAEGATMDIQISEQQLRLDDVEHDLELAVDWASHMLEVLEYRGIVPRGPDIESVNDARKRFYTWVQENPLKAGAVTAALEEAGLQAAATVPKGTRSSKKPKAKKAKKAKKRAA